MDDETTRTIIIDAMQSVINDAENWTGGLGSRLSPETLAKVRAALRLLEGNREAK